MRNTLPLVILALIVCGCGSSQAERRDDESKSKFRSLSWATISDRMCGRNTSPEPPAIRETTAPSDSGVRAKVEEDPVLEQFRGRGTGVLKAGVYDTISGRSNQILRCYERALSGQPGLDGRIVFKWTVQENGLVRGACIERSTVHNAALESCVLRVIRKLQFPEPDGGEVEVVYPVFFKTR